MAERFAFDGPWLDRAAWRRGPDGPRPQPAGTGAGARVLAFRDGMPRLDGAGLGWLEPGDPRLAGAGPVVFLGVGEGGADLFAATLAARPETAVPDGDGGDHGDLRALLSSLPAADAALAATGKALLGWHATHGFCAACGAPTLVTQAGWQRTCPACGACHFPRTDPVVIMLVTHGNSVLLGRSPGWPEGMYSLLAGFMEPGETIEAAVRREVLEEAGVGAPAVSYLASQPWPFPASLMIGCTAEASGTAIRRDPAELEDALWLGREELALAFAGSHPRIRAPRRAAIAGFLLWSWLADAPA